MVPTKLQKRPLQLRMMIYLFYPNSKLGSHLKISNLQTSYTPSNSHYTSSLQFLPKARLTYSNATDGSICRNRPITETGYPTFTTPKYRNFTTKSSRGIKLRLPSKLTETHLLQRHEKIEVGWGSLPNCKLR